MIRTLSEATRTMVASAGLDQSYWDLALLYVVWCRNRLINSTNKEATPHELFTGEKPDLSLARNVGLHGPDLHPHKERPKYAMHAKYGVFVGWSEASKAWEFIACLEYPGWAPPGCTANEDYWGCSELPRAHDLPTVASDPPQ